MPKPLVLNRSIRRGWVGPLEELGATEQIMTKLAVQETAILQQPMRLSMCTLLNT
jgi:hypothetical protein